jgi:ornithine decarboxylase
MFIEPWALLQDVDVPTPALLLDLDAVRNRVQCVRDAFSLLRPRIYYSCKANADRALLAVLGEEGCGFDVASINEIQALEDAGVDARSAIFSSTVKVPSHIAEAHARGIDTFAVDSSAEVEKLRVHAPGCKVVVRLDVPHEGSRWPLAGKFGVPPLEAAELLCRARDAGLQPHGLTFHVGSQCERTESWREAIEVAGKLWRYASDAGIVLQLVNFGGGLPARYTDDVPSVAEIGNEVLQAATTTFGSGVQYAIEPGRFIVAEAGTLVASVIGKATRSGKPWVFIDLSIYAGLLEVIGGWRYPTVTAKDHLPRKLTTLAGPSCDSTDIIAHDIELPDLEVGDRMLLLSAGAYTTAYRAYNGFDFPAVICSGRRGVALERAA